MEQVTLYIKHVSRMLYDEMPASCPRTWAVDHAADARLYPCSRFWNVSRNVSIVSVQCHLGLLSVPISCSGKPPGRLAIVRLHGVALAACRGIASKLVRSEPWDHECFRVFFAAARLPVGFERVIPKRTSTSASENDVPLARRCRIMRQKSTELASRKSSES